MQQKTLPIGYYIKLADAALTKGINAIQSQYGLDRTEWQLLNSIYERPEISKAEIFKLMGSLSDIQSVEAILFKFHASGYVAIESDRVSLTKEGNSLHASCLASQQEFRKRAMNDISETDYLTAISTLQKIIANIA